MKTVAMVSAIVFLLVGGLAVAQTEDEVEVLQRNCDSGVLSDCVKLGDWYDGYDNHTRKFRDAARAAPLFEKACNGGELLGCVSLGLNYERGQRSPQGLHAGHRTFP